LGPYYLGSHYAAATVKKLEGYQEPVDEHGAAIRKTGEERESS
jgi:hypothetical protein